tara:strand:- start:5000 stop:5170 length:171 start_codon:yes stop_codon:yes gene_type:complete
LNADQRASIYVAATKKVKKRVFYGQAFDCRRVGMNGTREQNNGFFMIKPNILRKYI